jgi:hypothetical protein
MPLNQLIEFCTEQYYRPHRCEDCPNILCENSCNACLEQIHRIITQDRTYNCQNIVYCYTCKFIYRYSTEIEYLLNQYVNIFRNVRQIRLWSIGCGPGTELFGINNFKIHNNLLFDIQYNGFDLNTIWRPIHDRIRQMDQFETNFHYENVFDYALRTEEQPNIIILNYVLSDILRTNAHLMTEFINRVCL